MVSCLLCNAQFLKYFSVEKILLFLEAKAFPVAPHVTIAASDEHCLIFITMRVLQNNLQACLW